MTWILVMIYKTTVSINFFHIINPLTKRYFLSFKNKRKYQEGTILNLKSEINNQKLVNPANC